MRETDMTGMTAKAPLNAPRVSAIIIFLNGEAFIAEAIESIRAQTFTDWELILVDDGTTDGATAIAQRYASENPGKIRYIDHPGHENRGMSASRNAGIHVARGEFVAFLDADDIWLPRRLEVHVAALDAHPDVSMTMGPTLLWSSWAESAQHAKRWFAMPDYHTELGLPIGKVLEPPIVAIGFLESHGGNVPGICSLLARRADVLAAGGFDDSFRTLYEDQVFFFRMTLRYRIIVLDEVLDYYRQHPSSAVHAAGGAAGDMRMRPVFLEWLQDEMIEGGFKSKRLWKAFRAEMWRFDNPRLHRWASAPRRLIDAWNVQTRRLVITVLTPPVYNWLRRKFRLQVVDVENVH
ncbi:MAG: glycosyltransferase family 2 protein [Paracoccaceae bacterium]